MKAVQRVPLGAAMALLGLIACAEEEAPRAALYPADFMSSWHEARDCRHSHEHELNHIRVFANDLAKVPYDTLSADQPYLPGATLVKVQYDDEDCTQLLGYTVLARQAVGYSPGTFDWRWQRLDAEERVLEDGPHLPRCLACHAVHCTPPSGAGFELTCADDSAPVRAP